MICYDPHYDMSTIKENGADSPPRGLRVLSIDPGYGRCGMAIVERTPDGKDALLFSECVETSAKADFTDRMDTISTECARLLQKFAPDHVAIEKLFFSGNQKTAMRVSEVRGALIQTATSHGIPVSEYTPAQIKNAAGGWGGADKKQVITMLRLLMRIDKEIQYDDEYDAIAVGVTHLAIFRSNRIVQ
jgi:crossover junction endodeoxyribonuclease RuvC